jgi:hypothetical protein
MIKKIIAWILLLTIMTLVVCSEASIISSVEHHINSYILLLSVGFAAGKDILIMFYFVHKLGIIPPEELNAPKMFNTWRWFK